MVIFTALMHFLEIIKLAWSNLRANLMRTILTMVIIALGITALVGILTSIDGIIYSMSKNFSSLGANTFSIDRKNEMMKRRRRGVRETESPPVTFDQAMEFKERFTDKALVSVSYTAISNATVKYANEETTPTIRVRGVDENYFRTSALELSEGRNFSSQDQEFGLDKVILGADFVKTLFGGNEKIAVGKFVSINDKRYQVIGILKYKGASINAGADKQALIPLNSARARYARQDSDFDLVVASPKAALEDALESEATGEMRVIRRLKPYEENDFEISRSDGLITFLRDNTAKLRAATVAIGLLTLLGAAIGLMNIMLVSVTERTREIGIAKALGATRKNIMHLFLIEAILICQIGGIAGVAIGIPVGNIVTLLMGGDFLIPWAWIILGLVVCMIVGILSGLYPATRAASLDPVASLRFE